MDTAARRYGKRPNPPFRLSAILAFTPATPSNSAASSGCSTITSDGEPCIQEATAAYRFKFHHDVVTALVRQDFELAAISDQWLSNIRSALLQ